MSGNFTSCLVQLSADLGLNLNAYLVLERKPTRQEQKLKTLRQYVAKYSSGWKKRLELADLLYEIGQWSQAVLEYKQVLKAQPQLVQPRIKLGKILQLMNREEEAIAVYEGAIFLAKKEATKQHLLGLIKSCQNKTQDAIAAFKSATVLEPNNLVHWIALVQIQMETEYPAIALSSLEKILSLEPNNFIALIYSHDMLLMLGNLSKAEKCLDRALEIAPQDFQGLKRLLTHRLRKKLVFDTEGKQTRKLLNSLLKKAVNSAEANSLQAQYYILQGKQDKGLKILKQFTEEQKHNSQGWYYYSQGLFKLGQHQVAADAILQAYELSSHSNQPKSDTCQIYRGLCEILPQAGRLTKTKAIMEEMLEKFPGSWSIWATAARVLVEYFQEIELGCSYSLQGTQLQPELSDSWFRHGRVLSLAGKYEEAIAALAHGWQLMSPEEQDFKSVAAAVWLGESYQKLGKNLSYSYKWFSLAYQLAEELRKFDKAQADYWQNRALENLGTTWKVGNISPGFISTDI